MNGVVVATVTIVALITGAILTWLLLSRSIVSLKSERDQARVDGENWRLKFNEAIVNLAGEAQKNKRLAEVESQLAIERDAASALKAEVSAFQRGEQEREYAHREQLKQLKELHSAVETKFGQLAGQAVEQAHDAFLKRAGQKLEATGKENAAKLETIL